MIAFNPLPGSLSLSKGLIVESELSLGDGVPDNAPIKSLLLIPSALSPAHDIFSELLENPFSASCWRPKSVLDVLRSYIANTEAAA